MSDRHIMSAPQRVWLREKSDMMSRSNSVWSAPHPLPLSHAREERGDNQRCLRPSPNSGRGRGWGVFLFFLLLFLFAACTGAPSSDDTGTAVPQLKLLATLHLSPTPADAEREATRLAIRAAPTTPSPTQTPEPTVYVGVFLGEAGGAADIERYQGTLIAALPTPEFAECANPTDPRFGVVWSTNETARAALGCAGEPAAPYVGTVQFFERGVMYWVPTGEIWTIVPGGAAGGQFWYVPLAPPMQIWEVPAPEGLRMPQLGFGAVWKAVDGVRQAVGFARTDETSASLTVQRFEGGALILDSTSGQVFALVGRDQGTAYGPY